MPFFIGVAAFLLWLTVIWGVSALARTSPGHPFRTIWSFRIFRRKLAASRLPDWQRGQVVPTEEISPTAKQDGTDAPSFGSSVDSFSPYAPSDEGPKADPQGVQTDDDWQRFIAAMKAPEETSSPIPDLAPLSAEGGLGAIGLEPEKRSQPKRAKTARRPSRPAASTSKKKGSGQRRQGRMVYVVVDDEGKPDLS
ncbi:MAG: hypothetical protein LC723_01490 [Actinobacteria bacterium]|nr:hypothetical protein [Actinomycetota bacterium]